MPRFHGQSAEFARSIPNLSGSRVAIVDDKISVHFRDPRMPTLVFFSPSSSTNCGQLVGFLKMQPALLAAVAMSGVFPATPQGDGQFLFGSRWRAAENRGDGVVVLQRRHMPVTSNS
jgi:hypothetical protein